jgi:hypothetical protein
MLLAVSSMIMNKMYEIRWGDRREWRRGEFNYNILEELL